MIESVLVGVEAAERGIMVWDGRVAVGVHGSIVLVTKGQSGTWLTLTIRFLTLPASGLCLVAFKLPLATCQAAQMLVLR